MASLFWRIWSHVVAWGLALSCLIDFELSLVDFGRAQWSDLVGLGSPSPD